MSWMVASSAPHLRSFDARISSQVQLSPSGRIGSLLSLECALVVHNQLSKCYIEL